MADFGDRAKITEERELRLRLKNSRIAKSTTPSLEYCLECKKQIPEGRRMAQPGCTLCVNCQQELEK